MKWLIARESIRHYLLVFMVVASITQCSQAVVRRAHAAPAEQVCEKYWVTGYVRGHHSPWTADGTSVWTREPIAAASYNVPMGSSVEVIGLGTFRVADRGRLQARQVDVLVDTVSEAHALTGYYTVCVSS